MEERSFSFDEFSVEMGEFEMKKVKKYDRLFRISEGGSIDSYPLVANGKVYFGCHNKNVYCLNKADGRLIWKFKAEDSCGLSSPALFNGMLFIGSYDHNVYALDAATGRLVWRFTARRGIMTSPVIMDGTIFMGSVDQNFYAIDAGTGALRWKFWTSGEILSDATLFEDTAIFGSYDKNLYCLNAADGRMLWKLGTSQEVVNAGSFSVKDGCLYVASFDNILRKVDAKTGKEIWKRKICQYGVTCGNQIHEGVLYVPTEDGSMLALDMDGDVIWKFRTNKPIGTPTITAGRVFFTAEDQHLYCLDAKTGSLVWKFRTFGMNWWRPAVVDGVVYFGSYDCHLYALSASDGSLLWKFRAEGSPSRVPPPYAHFELEMKIPERNAPDEKGRRYDVSHGKPEEAAGFYKSRITYQISSQYAAKGKYRSEGDGF